MLEGCDRKMEEVFFEHDGLQVQLDAKSSQFLWARNSLAATLDRLEQHCGPLAAIHLPLESSLWPSVSNLVDGVARLVCDKNYVICARLASVLALVPESLELDSQYMTELLLMVEQRGRVSTANPETLPIESLETNDL